MKNRRAIGPHSELREAQVAALIFVGVEVERQCEAAMGGRAGRIVAMWPEVSGAFVIARDEVPLDSARLELEAPLDRHQEVQARSSGG